jgi:hypothetical protein
MSDITAIMAKPPTSHKLTDFEINGVENEVCANYVEA